MAYMSQDKKRDLAPGIKAVLKKYGMKGTISVQHHSALVVTVKSGKIDFSKFESEHITREREVYGSKMDYTAFDVNTYHIENQWTGVARDFLKELLAAMSVGNFNKSDSMTDYFHVGWWMYIHVGRWDRPYVLEA